MTKVQFFHGGSGEEPLPAHSGQSSGGVSEDEQSSEHAHDTDDSDGSEEVCSSGEDTQSQLAQWAVRRQISHAALADLLSILSGKMHGLPKDPRTLLQTKTTHDVKKYFRQYLLSFWFQSWHFLSSCSNKNILRLAHL